MKLSKYGTPHMLVSKERVKMWDLKGERDRLLLVSRGHLKTTIHTVAHIIQWILNYPDVRILMTTATDEKAQLIVGKIKQHFQFNPRFRFLYPEFCPDAKKASDWGSKTELSVPNRNKRGDEPTIMTASVGKALASTHHDVIKCSDVVTENNVRTPGQIAEVKEFFGYLEPLRERGESKDGQPNPGWLDVEGTIYDFSDFYQTILDAEEKKADHEKAWKITKRSCWVDKSKRLSLWPERFPALELERIANSPQVGPVLFASQYELEPVSPETALATEDQILFFPLHIAHQLMPRYRVMTTVDLANPNPNKKTSSDPDYTVFTTAGFDRDGRCDVLSIYRGRFKQDEIAELFFLIQKKWPANIRFKVQKDHYGDSLAPVMQREMGKRQTFLHIELEPISSLESKFWRIQQLQGWFRMGNIRFADSITCKQDLTLEILRFPRGGHDDILDTIADLFHDARKQAAGEVNPDREIEIPWGKPRPVTQSDFAGFDPLTKEATFLSDVIGAGQRSFHSMTGI